MTRDRVEGTIIRSTTADGSPVPRGERVLRLYIEEVHSGVLDALRRRWRTPEGEITVEAKLETGLFEGRNSAHRARITEVTVTATGFYGLGEVTLKQAYEEATANSFDLSLLEKWCIDLRPKVKFVIAASAPVAEPRPA